MLFIGGTGRCGTSITRVALGGHRHVAALPFEHRFLIDPDGVLDYWRASSASWSPFLADRQLQRLERLLRRVAGQSWLSRSFGNILKRSGVARRGWLTPRQYQGWALNKVIPGFSALIEELLEELTSFAYPGSWVGSPSYRTHAALRHAPPRTREETRAPLRRFAWSAIDSLLAHQDKGVYVEDNTWNQLFFPELGELFPNGKLLHVYRDPRDVVTSLLTQRWAPTDVGQLCVWYRDVMTRWKAVRNTLSPDRFHELAWEDLVRDPNRSLAEVCNFAGLEFDRGVLDTTLSARSSGRWRRDLSAEDRALVTDQLADLIDDLGYQR